MAGKRNEAHEMGDMSYWIGPNQLQGKRVSPEALLRFIADMHNGDETYAGLMDFLKEEGKTAREFLKEHADYDHYIKTEILRPESED